MSGNDTGSTADRFADDPAFAVHEGGKISITPTRSIDSVADLALTYTPGVARVSSAIAAEPELAHRFTWAPHVVAVVSDGTAVLGLGDIGPAASLPVMEGKACLFKEFGGLDAVPIVLSTTHGRRHDRRDRRRDRPLVRRYQPGGHQRPPLLRDRGSAARAARHPADARRPARDGDRRPRRAAQRRQGGRP
jgi:hypothetical protein